MSAAQMAHLLKSIGKGSEYAGIWRIYRTGVLVGAGQAFILVVTGYTAYRLGKWGYQKLLGYLRDNDGYIDASGEVV